MVVPVTTYLGIGMYTPAEAAMYARVSSRMMSRWVHGDKIGKAAIRAQIPVADDKTVTFLDFIQTLAIRAIREQKEKVPLQKIREAIELATAMGVPYPFARQHSTFLWDGEIQLDVAGQLIQASGRRRGQCGVVLGESEHGAAVVGDADVAAGSATGVGDGRGRAIQRGVGCGD